jgi:hypothetical protein
MTKQNKRAITASPTSKPIIQKKTDSKETPNKSPHDVIGQIQEENDEFGSTWCAAETRCLNTLKAATSEIVCNRCKYNVHNDCCDMLQEKDKIIIYCSKCLNNNGNVQVEEQIHHNSNWAANNTLKNNNTDKGLFTIKHGSESWCAARTMCKNKSEQATANRCNNCRNFTHKECFDTVMMDKRKQTFCLWCVQIEKDFQSDQNTMFVASGNHQIRDTSTKPREEEIIFQSIVMQVKLEMKNPSNKMKVVWILVTMSDERTRTKT